MAIEINVREIHGKAKSGMTDPYICTCEDNAQYVVKGNGAGRDGRIKELVCAALGKQFGLAIPLFRIAYVDSQLLKFNEKRTEVTSCIGEGLCFASRMVKHPSIVRKEEIENINIETRCRILLFDWWIKNMDRSDTNTNLLWTTDGSIKVIDHNLAFDKDFEEEEFFTRHLFRKDRAMPEVGLNFPQKMSELAENVLSQFEAVWDQIPEEWQVNEYGDVADESLNYVSVHEALLGRASLMPEVFGESYDN
ncbi:MAG: hypothetical protein KAR40_16720 [Candidatus Sabulitectum sp.]|nr:hypothetical protein [Candidatus Sabulitectum sp.]